MQFEEALKNYLKTSEWKYQKSIDSGFDKLKNPVQSREAFDQLAGFSTGNLGLAGIIRNPAMSKQLADPTTAFSKVLDQLRKYNEPTLVQEGTGGHYLSDGALNFLAKNIGKYYQHVGTEKDPMYKLIEKGVVNADNLNMLAKTTPFNNAGFAGIKDRIDNSLDNDLSVRYYRKIQGIDPPYHNTSNEKKALEEFYDHRIFYNGLLKTKIDDGLDVFDFTADPIDSGFVQSISDIPLLVREAIDNNFLKESNMANSRIGLPDFMTAIARLRSQKNNAGLNEWNSTEPFLEVGPYSWHKLPYDIEPQKVEGRRMGNCAGIGCIAKPGKKDIYSLRRTDTNTPKVNFVHLPRSKVKPIEQIKGIANSTPKEKYFEAIQQLKQYLGIKDW